MRIRRPSPSPTRFRDPQVPRRISPSWNPRRAGYSLIELVAVMSILTLALGPTTMLLVELGRRQSSARLDETQALSVHRADRRWRADVRSSRSATIERDGVTFRLEGGQVVRWSRAPAELIRETAAATADGPARTASTAGAKADPSIGPEPTSRESFPIPRDAEVKWVIPPAPSAGPLRLSVFAPTRVRPTPRKGTLILFAEATPRVPGNSAASGEPAPIAAPANGKSPAGKEAKPSGKPASEASGAAPKGGGS
jgi:prepilin-type N-terminal cleavage/methylation domain-containing protein